MNFLRQAAIRLAMDGPRLPDFLVKLLFDFGMAQKGKRVYDPKQVCEDYYAGNIKIERAAKSAAPHFVTASDSFDPNNIEHIQGWFEESERHERENRRIDAYFRFRNMVWCPVIYCPRLGTRQAVMAEVGRDKGRPFVWSAKRPNTPEEMGMIIKWEHPDCHFFLDSWECIDRMNREGCYSQIPAMRRRT